MKLQNDLLLRVAKGEHIERIPVWIMRQAGRILPEYRKIRNRLNNFKELIKNPELVCEVTIQPVDILDVDAAIIFSDILVVPEAMGCNYEMIQKNGPVFPNPIKTERDVNNIVIPDVKDSLFYVFESIKIVKKELNQRVPLIGFAGAPWTIFSYMIEGNGSKTFSKARKMLYQNPILSHQLLEKITDTTILYLKEQINCGVDLIQIFDSWAGILPPEQYKEYSLRYIKKICNVLHNLTSIIIFAKGAWFALEELGDLNCDVIGIDWNMIPQDCRTKIKNKTLQGNLDPCLLYSDEKTIIAETKKMVQQFGKQKYIANLGHGVYPDTDFEKVKIFINTIKNI